MSTRLKQWIRSKASTADLRLFCVPHAGGAASMFNKWFDQSGADINVRALQLPGRENERTDTEWF
jgi:surfactin synthase thioesterase subunit